MPRPLTAAEKARIAGSPTPTASPDARVGPRTLTPEEKARVVGAAPPAEGATAQKYIAPDTRRASGRAGTDYASATADMERALTEERMAAAHRLQEQHPDISTDDAYALADEETVAARVAPAKAQAGSRDLVAAVTSGDPQRSVEARLSGGRLIPAARLVETGDTGSIERYQKDERRIRAMSLMEKVDAVLTGPAAVDPIEAQGTMKTGAIRDLREKGWTAAGAFMASPLVIAQEAVGLFGYDLGLPTMEDQGTALVEGWEALEGYATDKEVQRAVSAKGLEGVATRIGSKMGMPEIYAAMMGDSGMAQYAEDATYLPDFDEPAKALYTASDAESKKAAAEAFGFVNYGQLPKGLQRDAADLLALVKQDAREGRLTNAAILKDLADGVADSVLLGTIGRTSLAELGSIAPTASDITKVYQRRAEAMQATGGAEADRLGELFASGLYDVDHEADGKIWLKPSRFQHWLSVVGVTPELFYEADIPIAPALATLGAPIALPLYALAKAMGRDDWIAMAKHARIPNKVGLEFMAQTGAYDAPLAALGFKRGSEWSTIRPADSEWSSRILADVLNPEFLGLATQGTYRQAGGRVGSGADKALGVTDVAADFLFDAEGIVLGAGVGAAKTVAGAARGARLAPKGLKMAGALAHVAPSLRGLDGDAAFVAAMKRGIVREVSAGRMVPEDAAKHTANIDEMMRTVGLAPEDVRREVAGFATERAGRTIDDIGQMVNRAGTPEVQALRKSAEYLRVKAEVDALAPSASQAPVVMALEETAAQMAVDGGKVASLVDYFKARDFTASAPDPAYVAATTKLFQTGDYDGWLPQFAKKMRQDFGDDWTDDLTRFFDHEPDPTKPGKMRLTAKGEADLGEATRVVLRGKIHPNGRLRGYLDDIVDYLRNVWLRVRGKPLEVPDGFRAWWDATLDPSQAVKRPSVMVEADRLAPSKFETVTGPADIDLLREENPVMAAGKKREASRVSLEPRRARQAMGVKTTDLAADAVDAYATAYATVLLGQLRRSWGGEELTRMGTSVVPKSRAAKVERIVRGKLDAVLGKEWTVGTDGAVTLTPAQQAGVKVLIDEVAAEPMGEWLPVSLTGQGANLSTIPMADWNALNTALIDIHAGPGAWRDIRAEQAATSGLRALIGVIDDKFFRTGTILGETKAAAKVAFVVEEMAGPYLQNGGEREALEQLRRQLGDVSDEVRRKVAAIKRNDPDADLTQFYREMAGAIPPRIDPVRAEAVGKMHGAVGRAASTDDLFAAMDDADAQYGGLAAVLGASHRGVTPTELSALSELEAARTAVRAGTLNPADLASNPAYLDALGITQKAIGRRFAAMQETADTVLLAFSGGDESVLAGYGALRGGDDARVVRLYQSWFNEPAQWPTLWLELAEQGRQVVEKAGGSYNPNAAILAAIMRLRSKAIVADYFDGLLTRLPAMDPELVGKRGTAFEQPARMGDRGAGMEGHAERVQHYLDAITTWKTTNVNLVDSAGKQVEYRPALGLNVEGPTDFEAYADAQRIMAGLGWKYGEGTGWTRYVTGDREVFLPDLLVKEIDGVVDRTSKLGSAWSTDWARGGKPGTAASRLDTALRPLWESVAWTFGMARIGVTTGIILPNPAYFVGNAFGGMLQAYEGMGLQGVLDIGRSAVFLPGERAAMTRGVMARIWNDGIGVSFYRPNTPPIITPSGAVWTADAIADAYTRFGLNTSFAKAEAPRKLLDDIERQPGTWWQRWKRDPWMPARYWQDTLMESATSIDNFYRTATFIDGIKRGMSPEQAAEVARLTAFDYGALTDFEKGRARQVVMFYSYMRRNLDLTIWTLLNHPGRIATQMRGARALQEMWLGDDSEAYVPEYMDGRFLAYFHDALEDSQTANAKQGTAIYLPPAPYADATAILVDMINSIDGDPAARRELGARLTPWLQAPIVAMTQQELFSGRDVTQYNSVPGWLVETSRLWDGGILADNFLQVEPINQMDSALEANPGADRYQARNGVGWWNLRNLTPIGRPIDTLTQMARADFGETIFGEGGATQAGVDALRAYRESGGVLDIVAEPLSRAILPGDVGPNLREPMDMSPDLDTVRPGLTQEEELMALFGIKPIQIDRPEIVGDRAARDITAASKRRRSTLEKADPFR